jgi:hypothetical protein
VAAGIISQEVYDYIKERGLYQTVPPEKVAEATAAFHERYRKFVAEMQKQWPAADLSAIPLPEFKPTQSFEAQAEKMVRHVVTHLKLDADQQFDFRPKAEKILGIRYSTQPLRSTKKAGIYFGSFDGGVSAPQKEVIRQALGTVDVLYVSALGKSAKEIKMPLEERKRLLREQLAEFGGRVVIGDIPSLEESASTVRRIRNEHAQPTVAFFGTNVFQKNYERLKGISNLQFAAVPVPGNNPKIPRGTLLLGQNVDPCGLGNVSSDAPPTSL